MPMEAEPSFVLKEPMRFRVGPPSHIQDGRVVAGSGRCSACIGYRAAPSIVTLTFPTGANVGYRLNLCKFHVRDLFEAVSYVRSEEKLDVYTPSPKVPPASPVSKETGHHQGVRPRTTSDHVAGGRAPARR
jgi:hypothetical protein